jgi:hypothetical protein
VGRVHAFPIEISGRILNEGNVVAQLRAKASAALDAGVRHQADRDDLLDPTLCELTVASGLRKATLRPVLQHDDVALACRKVGSASAQTRRP